MANEYYRKARLYPTILTGIPLLVLVNAIGFSYFFNNLKHIHIILPYFTSAALSAAIVFLLVQINRFISKEIFQTFYFQDELSMPTTIHLLWRDNFLDRTIKRTIREKINSSYGIVLMDEMEEYNHEQKSKKQIVVAVSQIRNSLRKNSMLLQHNIEYGFLRNLIGGSLVAVISSIGIIIAGHYLNSHLLINTGFIFLVIYLTIICISKPLMTRYGRYYAKVLYEQFLSL